MMQRELFCALVGAQRSVFSVKINANESVTSLKIAIKTQKPDIPCWSHDLQLFLAKKNGEWLRNGEHLDTNLQSGLESSSYTKLHASWTLNERTLFGPNVPLEKGVIHVLVAIPQHEQLNYSRYRQTLENGVFCPCSDKLFSQTPTADNWLELPMLLLYIRSSYKLIAAQALSKEDATRRKYVTITGTPGVGKSLFLYYVMWTLVRDKKRVLFLTLKPPIYFNGESVMLCNQLPSCSNRHFWSPELWCLVDSVAPTMIAGLPIDYCSILLASTLRKECIGDFQKLVPTPEVFYMPLWSEDELSELAPLYPQAAAVWKERLNCLGGVPRLVLKDIETDPESLLTAACNDCSVDDCIVLLSIHHEINPVIQSLIHIHSEELSQYQDHKAVYASELAVQVIARTKWRSDRKRMDGFLLCFDALHKESKLESNPLLQSLSDYTFELYAMEMLERGGSFVYRKLRSVIGMQRAITRKRDYSFDEEGEKLTIPASQGQIVECVERHQQSDQLYVPRTRNSAAIDAWMPNVGGFQVTVGRSRDIRDGAAEDLEKLGPNANRLYFLLPPLYYDSFTQKTPLSIEQYAIRIPYPTDFSSFEEESSSEEEEE